jgi:DNA replication and repair protein RecF
VRLERLWLTDFRNYSSADITLPPGLTAVVGPNGHGKSNLLEAVGYLATLSSFRGATPETMVRQGAERAVVRAEGSRGGRPATLAAELVPKGRNRARLNGQPLRRARDLLGTVRASVFAPDDLDLVKGGPAGRRRYLDEALVAVDAAADVLCSEVERVLRQRNALLRQLGGRLDGDAETTLDVWDAKLSEAGERLAAARRRQLAVLGPLLAGAYDDLAEEESSIEAHYTSAWLGTGLAAALAVARADDLRRGVSTVGPHRDDVELRIGGLPARTHGSQGEQRTLALALRLAVHRAVAETVGEPPILLLDDVFSELDPARSAALVRHLPSGQCLLSTASGLPAGITPEQTLRVTEGTITLAASP